MEEHRLALATDSLKEALTEVDRLAFEQSDSLQPIVDEFGVEINEIVAVDRFSSDGVFATPSVRSAFMDSDVIENGFNSRVVEVGDTSIIVGRLIGRTEPTLRPFESVSDEIREKLAEEAAVAARDTKLDSVLEQLQDDHNYDAASLAAGSEWVVYERQRRFHGRSRNFGCGVCASTSIGWRARHRFRRVRVHADKVHRDDVSPRPRRLRVA